MTVLLAAYLRGQVINAATMFTKDIQVSPPMKKDLNYLHQNNLLVNDISRDLS